MTASVGFRAHGPAELARELLQRVAESIEPAARERLYSDADAAATAAPGAIPPRAAGLRRCGPCCGPCASRRHLHRALGEMLSEPKARCLFDTPPVPARPVVAGWRWTARTRMMYDARHVYINGESFRVGGRDARLLRRLADRRACPRRGGAS